MQITLYRRSYPVADAPVALSFVPDSADQRHTFTAGGKVYEAERRELRVVVPDDAKLDLLKNLLCWAGDKGRSNRRRRKFSTWPRRARRGSDWRSSPPGFGPPVSPPSAFRSSPSVSGWFGADRSPPAHLELGRVTLDLAVERRLWLVLDLRLERHPDGVFVEPAEWVGQRVGAVGHFPVDRDPGVAQGGGQILDRPLPTLARLDGDLVDLGIDGEDGVLRSARPPR